MSQLFMSLPEALRGRVSPEAPERMRMAIARAMLPMGPGDLFHSLACFIQDEKGALREAAHKSLDDVADNVVESVLESCEVPALLSFAARHYVQKEKICEIVLLNPHTPDEAFEWAGRRVSARLVDMIGNNQERYMRLPAIVESIYYNPEASMAVVNRVFETAVRGGLDLYHIPGFKEIYTAIFGEKAGDKIAEAEREQRGVVDQATQQALAQHLPEETSLYDDVEDGLDDDDFIDALRRAAKEEEAAEASGEEESGNTKPLHALVKEMNIPQKIRLALVGNKTARGLLIKDSKAVVALAVLKSPQLTDKEITDFCKNKALGDRVITAIARNTKWVRNRQTQVALIKHPKSPPGMTNRWVRQLTTKEIKKLSKSRDVPAHVAKLAKNVLDTRKK